MLESFITAQKFSVRRALRRGFQSYLTSAKDYHELLLHALRYERGKVLFNWSLVFISVITSMMNFSIATCNIPRIFGRQLANDAQTYHMHRTRALPSNIEVSLLPLTFSLYLRCSVYDVNGPFSARMPHQFLRCLWTIWKRALGNFRCLI